MRYLHDQLKAVREELNRLRRIEAKFIKEIRKQCTHLNIKRIAHAEPVNVRAFLTSTDSAPYKTNYRTTIKCTDCGKVLSRG